MLVRGVEQAQSPSLRATFDKQAKLLKRCCTELQDRVVALNETPVESGTPSGAIRRGIATLRDSVSAPDDLTLVTESLRHIERIEARYQEAVGAAAAEPMHALFARQYLQIQQCRAELADFARAFTAPVA